MRGAWGATALLLAVAWLTAIGHGPETAGDESVPDPPEGAALLQADPPGAALERRAAPDLTGQLVFWEQNVGQWPPDVLWVLRGPTPVALTTDGLRLVAADGWVDLVVDGGIADKTLVPQLRAARTTIQTGAEPWEAAQADRLRVLQAWPGIDLDLYTTDDHRLEFDLVVHPGADVQDAGLQVLGATPALEDGSLVLGDLAFRPPVSFQNGGLVSVDSGFVVQGQHVGFQVGAYDADQVLVIDPILDYGTVIATPSSSYLYDQVTASAETEDSFYFAGTIYTPFATTWRHPATTQTFGSDGSGYYGNAYFVRIDRETHQLVAFVELRPIEGTYMYTWVHDMEIDDQGRVLLAGRVGCSCWGTTYGIPVVNGRANSGYYDGFFARFDGDGGNYRLTYSTHIGSRSYSSSDDFVTEILLLPDGSFWLGGIVQGNSLLPTAPTQTANPDAPTTRGNLFAILWSNDDIPMPIRTTIVGSGSEEYDADFDVDEEGNVYFVATTAALRYLPLFPTTPDALRKVPIGGVDLVYGKIGRDGVLQHAGYWGSSMGDRDSRGGPSIAVVAKDQIAIVGTVGGCCVPGSAFRPAMGAYGSWDAFLSHIDIAAGAVLFSTHLGSTGTDGGYAVAYDNRTGIFYVGGVAYLRPLEPQQPSYYPLQRTDQNPGYEAFVTAIDPKRIDPGLPSTLQTSMVLYHLFVGAERSPTDSYVQGVRHLRVTHDGFLHVGGFQAAAGPGLSAPTTPEAIDSDPVSGGNYDGIFQRYKVRGSLTLSAYTETGREAAQGRPVAMPEPEIPVLITKSQIPVTVEADLDPYNDWGVLPRDLEWDLDGDGVYGDAAGPGPLTLVEPTETTRTICAQVHDPDPLASPLRACLEIFWQNQAPVALLDPLTPHVGMRDGLPTFPLGQPVWFDATRSYDPDGTLDHEEHTWSMGADVEVGSAHGQAAMGRFLTPGPRWIEYTVTDELGASATARLGIHILEAAPTAACAIDGPVRVGRLIDIRVQAAAATQWRVESEGSVVAEGAGTPPDPIRVRPPSSEGAGSLRIVLDIEGNEAVCTVDYEAGPRALTADFDWSNTPVAGERVLLLDRSHAGPDRPILGWEWHVDGRLVGNNRTLEHRFLEGGTHAVRLVVRDGVTTDAYTRILEVADPGLGPKARIMLPDGPHYAWDSIAFQDASAAGDHPIVARFWDLGVATSEGPVAYAAFPVGEHVISLSVRDAAGRVSVAHQFVKTVPQEEVVAEFTASHLEPWVGQPVTFTDASRTGAFAILDREWSFSDGSRGQRGSEVTHTFWQPGHYEVTLTLYEDGGSRHHARHTIQVRDPSSPDGTYDVVPQPLPEADAGPDHRVLAGSVVRLQDLSVASAGWRATWSQLEGPGMVLLQHGDNVSFRVPYRVGEAIRLQLELRDGFGGLAQDDVRLQIVDHEPHRATMVPPPDAGFQVHPRGERMVFEAPLHPLGAQYAWDLGDGTRATGREVVHTYQDLGTYTVHLEVVDAHGQTGTSSQDVVLRTGQDLEAPSIQEAGPAPVGLAHVLAAGALAGIGLFAGALLMVRRLR